MSFKNSIKFQFCESNLVLKILETASHIDKISKFVILTDLIIKKEFKKKQLYIINAPRKV